VLRFGTVAVTYNAPKRYDSEVYLLSKKIVEKQIESDALTPEELRYSASLTPLLAEKQRIYETAAANTNSWEAFHNLGVVLLQRAEKEPSDKTQKAYYRRAAVNFTLAAHRNPTAEFFYHAATAYHRTGDRLEALQNYDYAIKLGGPRPLLRKIFSDRAALEIEVGQPDEALRSLQYAGPSYQNYLNTALIEVGREHYELAQEQYRLAQGLRPAAAAPVYGLAVVAARQKDEAAVGTLLKQAVALDRSYAQRAVEDLEFQDYAQGKVFREALR
jgi:tetratricopeptide (TPR) repeat protein